MIAAGLLVAIGSALALLVNVNYLYLPLFIGLGLILAGLTGFCGMAILLEKIPWNK